MSRTTDERWPGGAPNRAPRPLAFESFRSGSTIMLRGWPRRPGRRFDFTVFDDIAHRPWPMPRRPWVMTQSWHRLLFAHWRASRADLRARLPAGLELDEYDGSPWLGIVPFFMTNVAPRGLPNLPGVSAFAELNVRTYVTSGGKPGVFFFSLDAQSRIAVRTARLLFNLPYFTASMPGICTGHAVQYTSLRRSRRHPAAFSALYEPTSPPFPAQPGSLEAFLTERYCLYVQGRLGGLLRGDIHHRPWALQLARADIETNTMAASAGVGVAGAPLFHYAERQDAVVWLPRRA